MKQLAALPQVGYQLALLGRFIYGNQKFQKFFIVTFVLFQGIL